MNVFHISLPPLRERKQDLSEVGNALIRDLSRKHGYRVTHLSAEVLRRFVHTRGLTTSESCETCWSARLFSRGRVKFRSGTCPSIWHRNENRVQSKVRLRTGCGFHSGEGERLGRGLDPPDFTPTPTATANALLRSLASAFARCTKSFESTEPRDKSCHNRQGSPKRLSQPSRENPV